MENSAVAANQVRAPDDVDVFEREAGGTPLIYGIIYWGVLALGFLTPIIGGIFGELH